jgi:hypothetical protein
VTLKADNLRSVGGYLSINSNVTRKQWGILKSCKPKKYYLSNECPKFILDEIIENARYSINNIKFEKELFDKVRKDLLTAEEVFKLDNIEQRRIAYEFMDKIKMKQLSNYTVLDTTIDKYDNKMELINFTVNGFDKPFKYLYCVCPSTKREYFVETQQDTCLKAKSKSFGMEDIEFNEEY